MPMFNPDGIQICAYLVHKDVDVESQPFEEWLPIKTLARFNDGTTAKVTGKLLADYLASLSDDDKAFNLVSPVEIDELHRKNKLPQKRRYKSWSDLRVVVAWTRTPRRVILDRREIEVY